MHARKAYGYCCQYYLYWAWSSLLSRCRAGNVPLCGPVEAPSKAADSLAHWPCPWKKVFILPSSFSSTCRCALNCRSLKGLPCIACRAVCCGLAVHEVGSIMLWGRTDMVKLMLVPISNCLACHVVCT